jgi:hypothetical protein
MMNATYLLRFNRKNATLLPGEKALIQFCVTHNRRKKWISTGIYVEKHQWNKAKGLVQKHTNQVALNIDIRDRLADLQNFELDQRRNGKEFTLELLSAYLSGEQSDLTFLDYMMKEVTTRTDIRSGTRNHHLSVHRCLVEFKKIKYFSDLTYQNIAEFDTYLRKAKLRQSTIYGYHKRLKSYIKRAIASERMEIESDPYLRFKCKDGLNTERKYLTIEELTTLERKDFKTRRLGIVRDIFVFCCYTGLAYTDAFKLTSENIIINGKEEFLKTFRTKTNEKAMVMLLPKAVKTA